METASAHEDRFYWSFIDHLVAACKDDCSETKAQSAICIQNARADRAPEDHVGNQFLASLTSEQRRVRGRLLSQVYGEGVFDVLVALHEKAVKPTPAPAFGQIAQRLPQP